MQVQTLYLDECSLFLRSWVLLTACSICGLRTGRFEYYFYLFNGLLKSLLLWISYISIVHRGAGEAGTPSEIYIFNSFQLISVL